MKDKEKLQGWTYADQEVDLGRLFELANASISGVTREQDTAVGLVAAMLLIASELRTISTTLRWINDSVTLRP